MNIPIGRPVHHVTAYIMGRDRRLQPIGIEGELYIGGAGVARGYIGNEALTKERFQEDPFREGYRMYKTGDLAKWLPDGAIDFLGRSDSQVKIRGFRIELEEIERQLRSHPRIKEAVVLVREKENDKFLVAWYIPDGNLDVADIKQHLSGKLPGYMVPAYYVRLRQMPLTDNGKIDKLQLPDHDHEENDGFIAPANAMEERMTAIWAEVLEIDKKQVSVTANFFDLGGHSLKAVTLISMIGKEYGVEIMLEDVFEKENIRNLSHYLTTVIQLSRGEATTSNSIEIVI